LNELKAHFAKAREKMLEHREKRIRPLKDKKILCDWNGLMIAALAKAGRVLDNRDFTSAARNAAEFILTQMRNPSGGMFHRFIAGEPAIPGFLDDYAFLVWGLIELYEATLEEKYLTAAIDVNEHAIKIFWDNDQGGFFFTREQNDLPVRKKETYDGALPSGNSVAMLNLIRLARLTAKANLEQMAFRISNYFSDQIKMNPLGHMQTLIAFGAAVWPSLEIVVSGDSNDPTTAEMLSVINNAALLDVNIILRPTTDSSTITELAPFTKNLLPRENKATVFICKGHQCEMPITDAKTLAQYLAELKAEQKHD
jgi:hypothetical protein